MTAANAPELAMSKFPNVYTKMLCELFQKHGNWPDVATDLAAKLAATEQERGKWRADCLEESALAGDLAQKVTDEKARADRAEAALVAAQEAMREAAAREIEEAPLLENADMQAWAKRDMELAALVRALPIPSAKPEGE